MSVLTIAFPTETAGPLAQALWGAIRPLLGLGLAATLLLVFRPLLTGLLRAALVLIHPRPSRAQRHARRRAFAARKLRRLAARFESQQPSQADELRRLASRG